MNIKKNLTYCATSPICHFVALCVGFLAMIEVIHIHAHYTMSTDTDSYVRNFCKQNLKECERIVSELN
jgi:hypothetical protein